MRSSRQQRLSLLGACLYLVALMALPCNAFQPPMRTVRSKPLMVLQAAGKRKQNQGNKRKPRFSQHVYKESQEKRQQEKKKNRNGRPAATSLSDLSQYASGTPYQEQQQRPETYTKRRKPNPTYISPNVPWNSGKSMEELESIMTNRWGTDSSKWSGDDEDDYEIVYEDEDGNIQMEDQGSGSNFIFNDPQKQQQEFYDADDVGFEPKSSKKPKNGNQKNKKNTDLNFDNLVAAQPVGGRGTNLEEDDDDEGGFFFQQPTDPVRTQPPIQPPLPPKRQQQARPDLKPFARDENGNPLFLTLEQAQKNFKALVQGDDEEEDLEWDVPRKTWEELGVTSEVLLNNLQRMHCTSPLAVQDKACPSIITGQDVLVGTYTGSGKTLAFLVPLIERILFSSEDDKSIKALVVVPGRELASQVVSVARQLLEGTGRKAMLAIGGTAFNRNFQDIRKKNPTIVVGTPGRIAELIVGRPGDKSGRLKVPQLQSLVLDEFDALLEYKPHRDPTAAIVGALKQRHGNSLQSILCSATATDMLGSSKLNDYLRPGFAEAYADEDDVFVTGGGNTGSDDSKSKALTRVSRTVVHGVIHVDHRRFALDTLRRILHTEPIPQQILIFAENPRKVGIVVEKLEDMGIVAAPLTGGANSEKMDRAEVAKALREGYVGIVVATEMAARGLDAPLLTHVINLDLPTDASHYAHRAGRCGRGGRPGVVINLTTSPQERGVPKKFADKLGVPIFEVEARAGKLHIVEDDA